MNTNSNAYTIIYSTIVVVLVAAILAFVSSLLKPMQTANIKAETISQMLKAAQFYTEDECGGMSNDQLLAAYSENIKEAFVINAEGAKVRDLATEKNSIELEDGLKAQDINIRAGKQELPVYVFNKDGKTVTVVPVYGAGLWGPVWGYVALEDDLKTIAGAYFDHASETPGLGAKIKDDPSFRQKFIGKQLNVTADKVFEIKKGASADDANSVDAITGATMTSKGLSGALENWLKAYVPFLSSSPAASSCGCKEGCSGNCGENCSGDCSNCKEECCSAGTEDGKSCSGSCAGCPKACAESEKTCSNSATE
jgi:NADH:ubiquinone oxidoreductase, Na(+)-translocating, C subunit